MITEKFSWKYKSHRTTEEDSQNHYFTQTFSADETVQVPGFCAGEYLATLKNAEVLFRGEPINRDGKVSVAKTWHSIKNKLPENQEDPAFEDRPDDSVITEYYDAIGFVAYAYFEKMKKCSVSSFRETWGTAKTMFGTVNRALFETENEAVYNRLNESLNNHRNKNDLIDAYCKEKGRCFAVFIPDPAVERNKYFAFSGFWDADDPNIRAMFPDKFDKDHPRLIDLFSKICIENGARWIRLNENVQTFQIDDYAIISPKERLGDLIGRSNLPASKRHFSCCERKFFAHFDQPILGTLLVRFHMCNECLKCFFYLSKNGSKIRIREGLIDR